MLQENGYSGVIIITTYIYILHPVFFTSSHDTIRLHRMDQDSNLRRFESYLLHAQKPAIVIQGPVPALSGMEMTLLYSLGEQQRYCDFTRRASYVIHKTIEQYLFLASLSCMYTKSSFDHVLKSNIHIRYR